ncbi:MAG TPA: DUF695 domain-containing protein [Rhizomicrobium sp.]|nr:DUF695 domain-containing protein [Rhizomicrobium sp.]
MRTSDDRWDHYLCKMDGAIASVFVDMDLIDRAPLAALAMLVTARVPMLDPRPDGLSSSEEFDKLIEIEEALNKASEEAGAAYVGRITTAGERDFFFYAGEAPACEDHLLVALAPFTAYRAAIFSRDDKDWEVYRDSLYPSPEARQLMGNQAVYDSLRKNGDTLVDPRKIDHWAYFPTEDARSVFINDVQPLGYDIGQMFDPGEDGPEFGVRFTRTDIPGGALDDSVLKLFRLADAAGGRYDGWESIVMKDPA